MDKHLKIGLIFMVAAVVLMPVSLMLKNMNSTGAMLMLVFTMLVELIGLIFVTFSILKKRFKG